MKKFKPIFTKEQKKWLEALRSGKYNQTARVLHDDEGYCCLGVACEVLGESFEYFESENRYIISSEIKNYISQGEGYSVLTDSLAEKLQLFSKMGRPHFDDNSSREETMLEDLTSYNDKRDYTFEEIADHIEEYPHMYFKNIKEQYEAYNAGS